MPVKMSPSTGNLRVLWNISWAGPDASCIKGWRFCCVECSGTVYTIWWGKSALFCSLAGWAEVLPADARSVALPSKGPDVRRRRRQGEAVQHVSQWGRPHVKADVFAVLRAADIAVERQLILRWGIWSDLESRLPRASVTVGVWMISGLCCEPAERSAATFSGPDGYWLQCRWVWAAGVAWGEKGSTSYGNRVAIYWQMQ